MESKFVPKSQTSPLNTTDNAQRQLRLQSTPTHQPQLQTSTQQQPFTPRSSSFPDHDSDSDFDGNEHEALLTPVESPHGDDLPPTYEEAQAQARAAALNGHAAVASEDNLEVRVQRMVLGAVDGQENSPPEYVRRSRGNVNRENISVQGSDEAALLRNTDIPVHQVSATVQNGSHNMREAVDDSHRAPFQGEMYSPLLSQALEFTNIRPDNDIRSASRLNRTVAIPTGRVELTDDGQDPTTTSNSNSRRPNYAVVRCYSKTLHTHSVNPAEFVAFLDGLNLLSQVDSFCGNEIDRLVPTYLYLCNANFFAPRGLRVRLTNLKSLLADDLNISEARGQRAAVALNITSKNGDAERKVTAIEPYAEPLTFDVPAPGSQTLALRVMVEQWMSNNGAGHMVQEQEIGITDARERQNVEDPLISIPGAFPHAPNAIPQQPDPPQGPAPPGLISSFIPFHNPCAPPAPPANPSMIQPPQPLAPGANPNASQGWLNWSAGLGSRMEQWGNDFGKHMEKWGEEFGKNVERRADRFGSGVERRADVLTRVVSGGESSRAGGCRTAPPQRRNTDTIGDNGEGSGNFDQTNRPWNPSGGHWGRGHYPFGYSPMGPFQPHYGGRHRAWRGAWGGAGWNPRGGRGAVPWAPHGHPWNGGPWGQGSPWIDMMQPHGPTNEARHEQTEYPKDEKRADDFKEDDNDNSDTASIMSSLSISTTSSSDSSSSSSSDSTTASARDKLSHKEAEEDLLSKIRSVNLQAEQKLSKGKLPAAQIEQERQLAIEAAVQEKTRRDLKFELKAAYRSLQTDLRQKKREIKHQQRQHRKERRKEEKEVAKALLRSKKEAKKDKGKGKGKSRKDDLLERKELKRELKGLRQEEKKKDKQWRREMKQELAAYKQKRKMEVYEMFKFSKGHKARDLISPVDDREGRNMTITDLDDEVWLVVENLS